MRRIQKYRFILLTCLETGLLILCYHYIYFFKLSHLYKYQFVRNLKDEYVRSLAMRRIQLYLFYYALQMRLFFPFIAFPGWRRTSLPGVINM